MEGSVHLYCTSWINISLDLTYINDSHLVTLAYKLILKGLNFPLKVSIAKSRLRSPWLVSLQALHRPALGSHVWKYHNKLLSTSFLFISWKNPEKSKLHKSRKNGKIHRSGKPLLFLEYAKLTYYFLNMYAKLTSQKYSAL